MNALSSGVAIAGFWIGLGIAIAGLCIGVGLHHFGRG